VPEVSLQQDEPVRCGFGAGGFGSQYAVAAGCAVRVADRVHINGALSYAPSVDYGYGSTPSVGGRLGISFPLGRVDKSKSPPEQQIAAVSNDLIALSKQVDQRDRQISDLKEQLEKLEATQAAGPAVQATSSEATNQLIALLRQRIEELETEKKKSEEEDSRQNGMIEKLQNQLADQESRFKKMMEQIRTLLPGSKGMLESSSAPTTTP
jgi:trimeric autotransporter adhesin